MLNHFRKKTAKICIHQYKQIEENFPFLLMISNENQTARIDMHNKN